MHKNIDIGLVRNEKVEMHSVAQSLHSIIFNVLDNAIKYTPENGVINVSIAMHKPQDTAYSPQLSQHLNAHHPSQEENRIEARLDPIQLDQRQYDDQAYDAKHSNPSRDPHTRSTPQVVLVVEDSGPGLDQAQYSQVLKRFYRVENHNTVGSGLGLAIVDQAIQQLGGELKLSRSEELGGLKVTIILPIQITAANAQ